MLNEGNEKIYLFEFYGSKGINDYLVTSDDLRDSPEFNDLQSLNNAISSMPSYEVVVIDPLTAMNRTYQVDYRNP